MDKKCTKCGEMKDTSNFTNDRGRKDGLCDWCKSCMKKQHQEYRIKNAEKERERGEKWRTKNRTRIDNLTSKGKIPSNKVCTKCGEIKPISEFSKSSGNTDGLYNWCKTCHSKHRALKRK